MPGVETAAGFQKAGISRYALNVVAEMARQAPGTRFEAYVNARFTRPEDWPENVAAHVVRKYRTHRYLAGLRSSFQGFDAWFVPAYDSLESSPVPQVAMIHDLFPLAHPEWFEEDQRLVMRQAIERTCKASRILLTNSQATKNELARMLPEHFTKARVVPMGLGNLAQPKAPTSLTAQELKRMGITFDRFVLTVGTLEPRKNLPRLLDAWSAVIAKEPNVGLVIVGAKGWESEELFRRMDVDHVLPMGYLDDALLPGWFETAECFVLASLDEGFGIPALEAMHYGCPLVLSDRGALPEVAGSLALYFDPESVDSIAQAILERLKSRKGRQVLVDEGKERAKQFTWQRSAELTLQALSDACGGKRA